MIRTVALMGTLVTIHVVGHGADEQRTSEMEETIDRAFGWFREVEACCTRFDARSEVMRLTSQVGAPVRASKILYIERGRLRETGTHESLLARGGAYAQLHAAQK